MKIPLNEISTPGLLRLMRKPHGLSKLCACRPRTMLIFA